MAIIGVSAWRRMATLGWLPTLPSPAATLPEGDVTLTARNAGRVKRLYATNAQVA